MALATRYRRAEEMTVREVMSGRLFSVGPDEDVRAALEAMRTQRVRRLPVVDAEQRLQGICRHPPPTTHPQEKKQMIAAQA